MIPVFPTTSSTTTRGSNQSFVNHVRILKVFVSLWFCELFHQQLFVFADESIGVDKAVESACFTYTDEYEMIHCILFGGADNKNDNNKNGEDEETQRTLGAIKKYLKQSNSNNELPQPQQEQQQQQYERAVSAVRDLMFFRKKNSWAQQKNIQKYKDQVNQNLNAASDELRQSETTASDANKVIIIEAEEKIESVVFALQVDGGWTYRGLQIAIDSINFVVNLLSTTLGCCPVATTTLKGTIMLLQFIQVFFPNVPVTAPIPVPVPVPVPLPVPVPVPATPTTKVPTKAPTKVPTKPPTKVPTRAPIR